GRSTVAGRKNHSDALRRGLLPKLDIELLAAGSETRFASAKTLAQDRRDVVVDDVDRGKIDACKADTVGIFGNHQMDGGAGRRRACPLDVEVCFGFVA